MNGINDFLVDTSVLLTHMRVSPVKSPYIKALQIYGVPVASIMSVYEVEVGGVRAGRANEFVNLFGVIRTLPVDREVVLEAAQIHVTLLKQNLAIGLPDTLIAATALVHQLPLLTVNVKHFSRVNQLQLLVLP